MVTQGDQRRLEHARSVAALEGEEHAIIKAAGQIGFFTLLSRITGLWRDVVIGSVFGAGVQTDAFFVAFRIPNLLRRLVGEGTSTAVLAPVITEYLVQRSRAEAMALVRALWGIGFVVLTLLTAAGVVFAAPLVRLVAPGFVGDAFALTVTLTRIMFFYLFCIGGVALSMGVMHALRHFAAPAFAPVLFNFAIISCALWLSGVLSNPILSLAYGVVIGGVCQLTLQIPVLRWFNVPLWPRWQPGHPAIKRISVLLLPLLCGTGIYQVNQIVSTLLASLLAAGSVSALWYAMRLFEFPVGVFVTALSTAALPSLAAQAQQGELIPLCASLGFALRLVNFVALPASVGLFLLAEPLSSVLFFHGAFGAGDVQKTAAALQGYAVGLWAIAATRLLSACLYALQDTRTPVIGSAIAFVVKVAFSVMLMGEVVLTAGAHSAARFVAWLTAACTVVRWGVTGLAVAASLSAFVNLLVQASVVIRRCGGFPWAAWRSSLMWSLAGCSVMAILLRWVAAQIAWVDAGTPFVERCIVLTAAILLGGVSYLVVAWQGGSNEFRALAGTLPQCALRFLPQFLQPRA